VLGQGNVEAGAVVARGDLLPGPPGQLTARRCGLADGLGDSAEGHLEDVVQDEDDPLSRAEPLQHDQQGEPDLVVEGDPVGGIGQRGLARRRDELDLARVVDVSLRDRADLIWSRYRRLVTTMSQPRSSSISPRSARIRRENASCAMSSAAPMSPSIRNARSTR
jgi:hypothetical protein